MTAGETHPDLPETSVIQFVDRLSSPALLWCSQRKKIISTNTAFTEVSGFSLSTQRPTLEDSIPPLSCFFSPSPHHLQSPNPLARHCPICFDNLPKPFNSFTTRHAAKLCTSPITDPLTISSDLTKTYIEQDVIIRHSQLSDTLILCQLELDDKKDHRLTEAHRDFISTVSHEFRTPLTSIKGFADTLLRYQKQLSQTEQQQFFTIMKEQADRLIRLVENLLSVSRLGEDNMEIRYRPVALKKMLSRVVMSVQAKYNQHRMIKQKIIPEDLELWADADGSEQVLINLIDNAIKYSGSDTTVTIEARLHPTDSSMAELVVRDNGVGISPSALENIFSKFYRVKQPLKQDVEGTGLGLYITKSIVQALGGHITVESQEGIGSTFTVLIPAATPERQASYQRRRTLREER